MNKRRTGATVKTAGPSQEPLLVPLKEAAETLGMSPWAVREIVWAGELPVFTRPRGRKWFFRPRDLREYVEKNMKVFV